MQPGMSLLAAITAAGIDGQRKFVAADLQAQLHSEYSGYGSGFGATRPTARAMCVEMGAVHMPRAVATPPISCVIVFFVLVALTSPAILGKLGFVMAIIFILVWFECR